MKAIKEAMLTNTNKKVFKQHLMAVKHYTNDPQAVYHQDYVHTASNS